MEKRTNCSLWKRGDLTPKVRDIRKYCGKEEKLLIVEKRRNCSLGAISSLFHNILLPIVRFPC